MRPVHTVHAIQNGDGEATLSLTIDCPWSDSDTADPAAAGRDCTVLRCAPDVGEHHGDHDPDDPCPELPGECLATHWLDAAGPESLDLVGFDGRAFPVTAVVSWGGEGPVLTAQQPVGFRAGDRVIAVRDGRSGVVADTVDGVALVRYDGADGAAEMVASRDLAPADTTPAEEQP